MDKKEVIKRFSEQGFLLSPEILERISEKNVDEILENAKKTRELIITSPGKSELSYRIRGAAQLKKLSPQDFVKYYNNKYEAIRNILLKKLDAVSINKAKTLYSNVSVIGMVNEKLEQGFILEDQTGSIEVRSNFNISLDDVVGAKGFVRNSILFAEEIILPDIPLAHKIGKIENTQIVLTTKITEKIKAQMNQINFVITPTTNISSKTITNFPNPAWITLSKKEEQAIVLVYQTERAVTSEQALDWLRKRYIANENILYNEDFLLEPLPDIIWLISKNEPWIENYKGVTIVSFGEPNYAKINLGTREVKIEMF